MLGPLPRRTGRAGIPAAALLCVFVVSLNGALASSHGGFGDAGHRSHQGAPVHQHHQVGASQSQPSHQQVSASPRVPSKRDEQPPLPPGWGELWTSDGRPYYVHYETARTQWERPLPPTDKDVADTNNEADMPSPEQAGSAAVAIEEGGQGSQGVTEADGTGNGDLGNIGQGGSESDLSEVDYMPGASVHNNTMHGLPGQASVGAATNDPGVPGAALSSHQPSQGFRATVPDHGQEQEQGQGQGQGQGQLAGAMGIGVEEADGGRVRVPMQREEWRGDTGGGGGQQGKAFLPGQGEEVHTPWGYRSPSSAGMGPSGAGQGQEREGERVPKEPPTWSHPSGQQQQQQPSFSRAPGLPPPTPTSGRGDFQPWEGVPSAPTAQVHNVGQQGQGRGTEETAEAPAWGMDPGPAQGRPQPRAWDPQQGQQGQGQPRAQDPRASAVPQWDGGSSGPPGAQMQAEGQGSNSWQGQGQCQHPWGQPDSKRAQGQEPGPQRDRSYGDLPRGSPGAPEPPRGRSGWGEDQGQQQGPSSSGPYAFDRRPYEGYQQQGRGEGEPGMQGRGFQQLDGGMQGWGDEQATGGGMGPRQGQPAYSSPKDRWGYGAGEGQDMQGAYYKQGQGGYNQQQGPVPDQGPRNDRYTGSPVGSRALVPHGSNTSSMRDIKDQGVQLVKGAWARILWSTGKTRTALGEAKDKAADVAYLAGQRIRSSVGGMSSRVADALEGDSQDRTGQGYSGYSGYEEVGQPQESGRGMGGRQGPPVTGGYPSYQGGPGAGGGIAAGPGHWGRGDQGYGNYPPRYGQGQGQERGIGRSEGPHPPPQGMPQQMQGEMQAHGQGQRQGPYPNEPMGYQRNISPGGPRLGNVPPGRPHGTPGGPQGDMGRGPANMGGYPYPVQGQPMSGDESRHQGGY